MDVNEEYVGLYVWFFDRDLGICLIFEYLNLCEIVVINFFYLNICYVMFCVKFKRFVEIF